MLHSPYLVVGISSYSVCNDVVSCECYLFWHYVLPYMVVLIALPILQQEEEKRAAAEKRSLAEQRKKEELERREREVQWCESE